MPLRGLFQDKQSPCVPFAAKGGRWLENARQAEKCKAVLNFYSAKPKKRMFILIISVLALILRIQGGLPPPVPFGKARLRAGGAGRACLP